MRWLIVAGVVLGASVAPAALAWQAAQTKPTGKDMDLPPHIAALPFEIRNGYRTFMKRCTTCHDTKRVDEARGKKTLFDWQGTVGTMALKPNANIPLDDRNAIFLYLSYLHGTGGSEEHKSEYLAFLAKCEDCHGVALVYKDKKPLKDWPEIISRMARKNNANIQPEDEKKVMGYINRMHPDIFGVE